jgi:hypothetical protein
VGACRGLNVGALSYAAAVRDLPKPRPATPVETAVITGLFPDLFPDEPLPLPGTRQFEVTATVPASSAPLMLITAAEGDVMAAFGTAFDACRDMRLFEVTVRLLG